MSQDTETQNTVERENAEGKCPACGSTELQNYPVLSEGGWFLVTKCQSCLNSIDRKPWNKLGYVTREVDTL